MPPAIYEQYVDKSIWFIDPKIFQIAQFIRDRFGKPVTINNYLAGGNYQYSAFRDSACTIGATNSQHRHGRAIDFRIQGMGPMEIRADIIKNFELYRASGLTTIEGGTPAGLFVISAGFLQQTSFHCRSTGFGRFRNMQKRFKSGHFILCLLQSSSF